MSITQKDIKLLWGRAGSRCAICRVELSHDVGGSAAYLVGEQAHIVGETVSAARGRSSLALDERNTYHNLILFCPNHHTEIDKNEADWPIEKLYQLKSKHELWVRESLSSAADLQAQADALVVSSNVDCVVQSLKLEDFSIWTSYTLSSDPAWPEDLIDSINDCMRKMLAAIWPTQYQELERAALTLALCAHKASQTFLEHAERRGENWRSIRFYREGGWNLNYDADLERYKRWICGCYEWVYKMTKAANWFADIVRRDVNPLFFVENGRFITEEGPFLDATFHTALLQFTDAEKALLPSSLFDI